MRDHVRQDRDGGIRFTSGCFMDKVLHNNLVVTLSNLIITASGGGGDMINQIDEFKESLEEWYDAAVEDIVAHIRAT